VVFAENLSSAIKCVLVDFSGLIILAETLLCSGKASRSGQTILVVGAQSITPSLMKLSCELLRCMIFPMRE
jgi:hypothetical protein